jgi:hypothetical protein
MIYATDDQNATTRNKIVATVNNPAYENVLL